MAERCRENPFGIPEDDEFFDEKLAEAADGDVGEVNMTKAWEWLEKWQNAEKGDR